MTGIDDPIPLSPWPDRSTWERGGCATDGTTSRSCTGRTSPRSCRRCCPTVCASTPTTAAPGCRSCPFEMRDAMPRWLPALPWISSFAETNVRTYVVDSTGNRAVWFFSLEATRLPIVVFARWLLGFPYVWATMTTEARPGWRRYTTTRRRWPNARPSTTHVEIDIGDPIAEPSELDVFLTGRWGAVSRWPMRRGRLRHHPVDHPVWQLHEATLARLRRHVDRGSRTPPPRRSSRSCSGSSRSAPASDAPIVCEATLPGRRSPGGRRVVSLRRRPDPPRSRPSGSARARRTSHRSPPRGRCRP